MSDLAAKIWSRTVAKALPLSHSEPISKADYPKPATCTGHVNKQLHLAICTRPVLRCVETSCAVLPDDAICHMH